MAAGKSGPPFRKKIAIPNLKFHKDKGGEIPRPSANYMSLGIQDDIFLHALPAGCLFYIVTYTCIF
jgi:hypothetical protein